MKPKKAAGEETKGGATREMTRRGERERKMMVEMQEERWKQQGGGTVEREMVRARLVVKIGREKQGGRQGRKQGQEQRGIRARRRLTFVRGHGRFSTLRG